MADYSDKTIVMVGKKSERSEALINELRRRGIFIKVKESFDDFKPSKEVDLIILNLLGDSSDYRSTTKQIVEVVDLFRIPILALIPEDQDIVQEVLTSGIADCSTENEDVEQVLQKIERCVETSSGDVVFANIDITPVKTAASTAGIRVFGVEDDPLLRNLLSVRLEKADFPHEFGVVGTDIIAAMRQFEPDVIVLDLMLPGISGFEILSKVKRDVQLKKVPVLVFSNRDSQEDKQRAFQLGASAFFVKAMTDLSELITKIEGLAKTTS